MTGHDARPVKPLVKERLIPAPRAEVWNAFTTTEGAQTFLSRRARIELRRGGPYEVYFDLEAEPGFQGSEGCRVLSYLQGHMVSFTWNAPPQFENVRWRRTFVVVELEEASDVLTRVRITHDGWERGDQWDEVYAYFDRAWSVVLGNLESRFRTGPRWEAVPDPDPTPPSHYVYYIHPAREGFFDAPTELEQTKVAEHARYVRSLLAQGRLVLAGPSYEPTLYPETEHAIPLELPPPGIVVFKARDDAEARRILENDPAVAAGVFKGRVNAFTLSYLDDIAP